MGLRRFLNSFLLDTLLVVVCISLVVFAPDRYDYIFCRRCCVLYIFIAIISVLDDFIHKRYLSFNLFFFVSLFATSFLVPLSLYSQDIAYKYYDPWICKSTAYVLLSVCFYYMGWKRFRYRNQKLNKRNKVHINRFGCYILNILSILVTIFFIITFLVFLRTSTNEINDMGLGSLTPILQSVLSSSLVIHSVAYKNRCNSFMSFCRVNIIILICLLIVIICSLYIGDRTIPIYFILVTGSVYTILIKPMNLLTVVIIFLLTLAIMYTVGQTRMSSRSFRDSSFREMLQTTNETISQVDDKLVLFSDFIPANKALYLCFYWRDWNNGRLYYPWKIFVLLASPIPYFPSLLSNIIYDVPISGMLNSDVLTTSLYGKVIGNINGGLGSEVVGDVYVSWGALGIVFFFFIFGAIVGRGQKMSNSNLYWSIVYIMLIGNAIYIPRATLFGSYRPIVFALVLAWLLTDFKTIKE